MKLGPGRLLLRALPWLLAGCVFDCGDTGTPAVKRSAAPLAAPGAAETAKREPLPKPAGPVTPWQSFTGFAPDALAGYAATGAAEGRNLPVPGGGEITALKRHYEKDGAKVDLEIIDALYAPAVRQIVKKMKESDRSTEGSVLKGTSVGNYPAVVQWTEKSQTGRIGVLLDDRYIVNVVLTPAPAADLAGRIVSALALDAIAKVEPPKGSATPSSQPAPAPGAGLVPGEQVAPSRPPQ